MKKIEVLDIEKGLRLIDLSLSEVAKFIGGTLIGEDQKIEYLSRLKFDKPEITNLLTYVTSLEYWEMFCASQHNSVIVNKNSIGDLPLGKSAIIVERNADQVFFDLHEYLAKEGFYPKLKSHVGLDCNIHPSAVIYDNVIIGNNVKIDANVVIYPNTIIDEGVVIKAGSIIGGQGGEYKLRNGFRKRVTHTGGTYIGQNVEIGSVNTIDCHLMGFFTKILNGTKTDNQVQIAHNVEIGEDCTISSCTEISGSVIFGNGIWYGPHSCCTNEIIVGDGAFIALGSILIHDVPAYGYMVGNPTRQTAWICKCHKHKLVFENNSAKCLCGREYKLAGDLVILERE